MIVGATAPKDRQKYAQDRPHQPRPCGFQREGVMPPGSASIGKRKSSGRSETPPQHRCGPVQVVVGKDYNTGTLSPLPPQSTGFFIETEPQNRRFA
jgi:hypothetical protein